MTVQIMVSVTDNLVRISKTEEIHLSILLTSTKFQQLHKTKK